MPAAKKAAKTAAIDLDEIGEKALSDVSAADFLAALDGTGIGAVAHLRTWPEKKKVELWAEPEHFGGVRVSDLVRGIREKKKLELEKSPVAEMIQKPVGVENVLDPRDVLRDPAFIGAVAREVATQLRAGGGR
jgi:hypothetical protein